MSISYLAPFDPDGAGPAAPELVVSGVFLYAGTGQVGNLARFAPASGTWAGFGVSSGSFTIGPLVTLPSGELVHLWNHGAERWNGVSFEPLVSGLNTAPSALVQLSNGDVVVGGAFTDAEGVAVANIARWDGTTWSPLGAGLDGAVDALLVLPGDHVVAAGAFTTAGGVAAARIAVWDGVAWSPLGLGMDGRVSHLALRNGEVVAAGAFANADGMPASGIARWDGLTWSPLGSGIAGDVQCLTLDDTGDVIVGGTIATAGGVAAANIARWDGANWFPFGVGRNGTVRSVVAMPGAGVFVISDAAPPYTPEASASLQLARWNGSDWRPLGPGIDAAVRASTFTSDGDTVFGGDFSQAGNVTARHVARWSSGGTWSALGGGVDGPVRALATLADGSIAAGGDFTHADAVPAARVARWNGTAWSAMGGGVDGTVRALASAPDGSVVAGGDFVIADGAPAAHVARFDGVTWSAYGAGTNGTVRALVVLPDGDVIAGGDFTSAGGAPAAHIARWNGTSWSALGLGVDGAVAALAVLPNGDVVAGGTFQMAGGAPARQIARWDGATWWPMQNDLWGPTPQSGYGTGVTALAVLPDGDLVGSNYNFGFYVPGQPASRITRWNGEAWSLLGTTLERVYTLAADPAGRLAVGGTFVTAEDTTSWFPSAVSAFAARYETTCPASASVTGAGCAGNTLTAASLPWVDATFRARGTGLTDPALVVALSSFTSLAPGTLPLDSLFGGGVSGCDVLVDTEILQNLVSDAGSAESSLYLPPIPPLVGLSFFHQMIAFAVDGGGSFLAVTATNALHLTVGDL